MLFVCNHHAVAALLLFCCLLSRINATTTTRTSRATSPAPSAPETCAFRTINYITDSLPQKCLRSSWSNANATSHTKSESAGDATVTQGPSSENASDTSTDIPSPSAIPIATGNKIAQEESRAPVNHAPAIQSSSATVTKDPALADIDTGELNEASFLSFEDWKKQTLEKAGQANVNIGNKKAHVEKNDPESVQNNLDSFGDDGEIELDFGAFKGGGDEGAAHKSRMSEPDTLQDSQDQDGTKKQKDIYRSKDAGITCKERFSYASFDAGATVLKTHPGAKNAKAVLIENKDSYMLSECAAENKFLIIELSEDIWIDTLVLANYEFFSSMIRTFRVSVSDRYPVKMEKWKDLGIYEARNSRDIQAFLIENPQIWARYLRIEFLSHYGNEYYCPLSLVRVHGTRMLESWKETEAINDEDDSEDNDEPGTGERFVPEAVAEVVQEEERSSEELKEVQVAVPELAKTVEPNTTDRVGAAPNSLHLPDVNSTLENESSPSMTTNWVQLDPFGILNQLNTCQAPELQHNTDMTSSTVAPVSNGQVTINNSPLAIQNTSIEAPAATITTPAVPPIADQTSLMTIPSMLNTSSLSDIPSSITETLMVAKTTSSIQESNSLISASVSSKLPNVTSSSSSSLPKNKTSSTSSASSSLPTIQESFFKAVSRRLHLLETNSTLSLKYIEEQSKILREAFTKVEKKQLQKTSTFLDTLNSTVLAELRGFRQQYDEIWQSTVISLDSQREESRREILAISARLTILADEVVFQKRMSIVQSVLLLLCLGLVIFSRVSAGGHLDFPSMQMKARNATPVESPVESPQFRRTGSLRHRRQWLDPGDGNPQQLNGFPISRSRSREYSPPTPVSTYSRSDNAFTPPTGGDDYNLAAPISENLELPVQSRSAEIDATNWNEGDDGTESVFSTSLPARISRTRKGSIGQQASTPSELEDGDELMDNDQNYLDIPVWIQLEQVGVTDGSPSVPSPPSELRSEFSVARKPLPALPPDAG